TMPGFRSHGAPPTGYSNIRYVTGSTGQPFREVLGPGDCCAADAPRTAERAREARQAATAAPTPPPAPAATAASEVAVGLNVQGLPMITPPCGLIGAINLRRRGV